MIHKNKRYILNIDLENFFNSFHFGRVMGYFNKNRYFNFDKKMSIIIAQLCCLNGALPQGAPTSPIISNLICRIFDYRILKITKKYKLNYTRYADDLTFSTNDNFFYIIMIIFLKTYQVKFKNQGLKSTKTKLGCSIKIQSKLLLD